MANEEQEMMAMVMPIMMMLVMVSILPAMTGGITPPPPPADPPPDEPPPDEPPPEANQVVVRLINVPAGGNKWQMAIAGNDFVGYQSWGTTDEDNIALSPVFDIPDGTVFPLLARITIYQELGGSAIELYHMQSFYPFRYDPDLGDWGSVPDPTYVDATIPALGLYDYDVEAEAFVQVI